LRHARFLLPQGHVRKLILPLTLVAALALAACGGGSSDKTTATSAGTGSSANAAATTASTTAPITTATAVTTPDTTTEATSASTPAATTAAGSDDVTSEFEKMVADAWASAKSYKTTLNIYDVDATEPAMTSTTETMAPDKEHTVSNFAGQTMESIRIGDDTYVKFGDTWQKSPGLNVSSEPPVSADDVVSDFADPSTPDTKIVKKGEETIDGVKAIVYEASDDGTIVTFWIGKDDHLPRKTEIKSDTGHFEVIFSDYGKDFGIKAPI